MAGENRCDRKLKVGDEGHFDSHIHKFRPFQADIREFKESRVADGIIENVDTIVVPANKVVLKKRSWGKIAGMLSEYPVR